MPPPPPKPSPVTVDTEHLDREWVQQPNHMLRACEAEADAAHEHAVAEAAFDLAEAELFLAIKFTPSEYDLDDKPNLDVIKSKVITLPRYKQAQARVIEAKHKKDMMAARVTALAHKRTALEHMTLLGNIDRNSEPRVLGNGASGEATREAVKRAKEEVAYKPIKNLNRKTNDRR